MNKFIYVIKLFAVIGLLSAYGWISKDLIMSGYIGSGITICIFSLILLPPMVSD